MKAFSRNKAIALLLAFAFVFSLLTLPSCMFLSYTPQPMRFTYDLTESDVEDALAAIQRLENAIDEENDNRVLDYAIEASDWMNYLQHQYVVGQVAYFSDLEDSEAYDHYVLAEESYMEVREEMLRVLKKLYATELSAKDVLFSGWTDAELQQLEYADEETTELEMRQSELTRKFLALEDPDSEAWSAAVEELYLEFVETSQELAAGYSYDNYYEYAAAEIYLRSYTEAQREAFRTSVKEIILPFYEEIDTAYQSAYDRLSEEQQDAFDAIRWDKCDPTNEILTSYINSFPTQMKTVMNNLFVRDALVYTEAETAHETAYTGYSAYCDQPFIFLGNGYQDLLTLVHELGHYAAYYHFTDASLPYDLGEVHSQGNEWLLMHYLAERMDADVYEVFLLWRLRYGLSTIILSTIVDEYEEAVYTSEEIASPETFEHIFAEVLEGYENIEAFDTKEDLYLYTQHVTIQSPVYYLSYATSELVSMSFFSLAEVQGFEAAQDVFVELCLRTQTNKKFLETLQSIGLPDPFQADTVDAILNAFATVWADNQSARAA